ncbi:hypothetical protein RHMOL_Rhmol02G0008300 [Rhododendron molle]|uniref:Uncharacterized protein n=1 Tax=Rhododendron molle TaxID=49168 RepID=A0ACC0PLK5_RHOML|nr:hypothetical protein RHMOL_Rhmol02G0008300 [Rhododendron molle]
MKAATTAMTCVPLFPSEAAAGFGMDLVRCYFGFLSFFFGTLLVDAVPWRTSSFIEAVYKLIFIFHFKHGYLLILVYCAMSRCFPFPPPGYEKKARLDEANSLNKIVSWFSTKAFDINLLHMGLELDG